LVIQVPDDARCRILFIGTHWATFQTPRFCAVVTGTGDSLQPRLGVDLARERPDIAPGFLVEKAVHRVTGHHAGFAAGAAVKVDLKGVLLSLGRFGKRDQAPVETDPGLVRALLVPF
jgi:hypothetical protein